MKKRKNEHGQAIVLLTLGIITLLGFTALAIDGGRVYSERRNVQGVADTTAMTGALYIGRNGTNVTSAILNEAVLAALVRAEERGYPNSQVTVTITEDADYYYVQAHIDSEVDPVMAQIVYSGDLMVAAETVARVRKISAFAFGQAFYAKNKSQCKALDHSGNADVTIINSGIFSNSNCGTNAINIQGSATFDGEIIAAVGGIYIQKPEDVVAGSIVTGVGQQTLPTLTPPDCGGLTAQNDSGTDLVPGIYAGGIQITGNQDKTLAPGLYCLDSDLRIQNGSLTGDDVTFYLRGTATVMINGGLNTLTAPQGDPWMDASGNYWNGMLMFQEYGNTSEFVLNGNAGSYFEGTIFVPDANCRINGSGATNALDVQVICDTIDFIGTADMYLVYNDANKYVPPLTVDLFK